MIVRITCGPNRGRLGRCRLAYTFGGRDYVVVHTMDDGSRLTLDARDVASIDVVTLLGEIDAITLLGALE